MLKTRCSTRAARQPPHHPPRGSQPPSGNHAPAAACAAAAPPPRPTAAWPWPLRLPRPVGATQSAGFSHARSHPALRWSMAERRASLCTAPARRGTRPRAAACGGTASLSDGRQPCTVPESESQYGTHWLLARSPARSGGGGCRRLAPAPASADARSASGSARAPAGGTLAARWMWAVRMLESSRPSPGSVGNCPRPASLRGGGCCGGCRCGSVDDPSEPITLAAAMPPLRQLSPPHSVPPAALEPPTGELASWGGHHITGWLGSSLGGARECSA